MLLLAFSRFKQLVLKHVGGDSLRLERNDLIIQRLGIHVLFKDVDGQFDLLSIIGRDAGMNGPDGGCRFKRTFLHAQDRNDRLQALNHTGDGFIRYGAGRQHNAGYFRVVGRQICLDGPNDDIPPVAGRYNQHVFLDVIQEVGQHHRASHKIVDLIGQQLFPKQQRSVQAIFDLLHGRALQPFFPGDDGNHNVGGQLHLQQFPDIVDLLSFDPIGHDSQDLHLPGFEPLQGAQSRADNLGR